MLHPSTATLLAYGAITSREDEGWLDPRSTMPIERFAAHARFLARHRRVLSLTELLDLLDTGSPVPRDAVVITIDEAHRNTIERAVPVLARFDLPATIYVTTRDVAEGRPPERDELYALFAWRTGNALHLAELGPHAVSLYDPDAVRETYLALERRLVTAGRDERERLLDEVRAQLQPARLAPRSTATWAELHRACAEHAGIEIGVRTRNRLDLVTTPGEDAVRDIVDAVGDVRDALGVEARHLSYPFNRCNLVSRGIVRSAGLRSAAVVAPERQVDADADRYALARVEAPVHLWGLRMVTNQRRLRGPAQMKESSP
jgi:peptidoglycan/xylan/chitin deacetylase (PgdA/CDA1 family)